MSTSKWGRGEINPEASKSCETDCEPEAAPPKLWLCSSVGTIFPTPKGDKAAAQDWRGIVRGTANEEEHASHHTLMQNVMADYNAYILLG